MSLLALFGDNSREVLLKGRHEFPLQDSIVGILLILEHEQREFIIIPIRGESK